MFAGWRSVPSGACASAESGAELGEAGLSVRTYTENFCCSHPDEAREAMGRYQGTPGGSVILYIHPSHALRPEDRRESLLSKLVGLNDKSLRDRVGSQSLANPANPNFGHPQCSVEL